MAREKDAHAPLPDSAENIFLEPCNYQHCARCNDLLTPTDIVRPVSAVNWTTDNRQGIVLEVGVEAAHAWKAIARGLTDGRFDLEDGIYKISQIVIALAERSLKVKTVPECQEHSKKSCSVCLVRLLRASKIIKSFLRTPLTQRRPALRVRVPLLDGDEGELYSYAHVDCKGPMPKLWDKVRHAEGKKKCDSCEHQPWLSFQTLIVPLIYPAGRLIRTYPSGVCEKYDKQFHKLDRKNARSASGWYCINPDDPTEASKWIRVLGYTSDNYPCKLGLHEQLELVCFSESEWQPPIDIREAEVFQERGFYYERPDALDTPAGSGGHSKSSIEESEDDEGPSERYESQFDWMSSRLSPNREALDDEGKEEVNWFPYPCDIATRNESRVSLGDAFPAADIYDDEEEQLPSDLKPEKEDESTASVYVRWLAKIRLHPDLSKPYPCRLFVDPFFVPGTNPQNIQPKRFPTREHFELIDGTLNEVRASLHDCNPWVSILGEWIHRAQLVVKRRLKLAPYVPEAELSPMSSVQNPDGTNRSWVINGKVVSSCYSTIDFILKVIQPLTLQPKIPTLKTMSPEEASLQREIDSLWFRHIYGMSPKRKLYLRTHSETRRTNVNEKPILPPSSIAEIARTTDVRLVGYPSRSLRHNPDTGSAFKPSKPASSNGRLTRCDDHPPYFANTCAGCFPLGTLVLGR